MKLFSYESIKDLSSSLTINRSIKGGNMIDQNKMKIIEPIPVELLPESIEGNLSYEELQQKNTSVVNWEGS